METETQRLEWRHSAEAQRWIKRYVEARREGYAWDNARRYLVELGLDPEMARKIADWGEAAFETGR